MQGVFQLLRSNFHPLNSDFEGIFRSYIILVASYFGGLRRSDPIEPIDNGKIDLFGPAV